MSLSVVLQGSPTELEDGISLADLIIQLGLTGRRMAVEINAELVPRSLHADTLLKAGDHIEIVHAIGGG
ncbi:MAG: sulfur carrier protein ThiS [Pseudomonadales bacterium]|nr:sulfur carrier protein ThiS [Pseudomonadales bacterium]